MKRILSLILVLVMMVGCLASCDMLPDFLTGNKDEEPEVAAPAASLDDAKTYLFNTYKNSAAAPANDYDLVAKVIINNVTFTVTWTVSVDSITIKESNKANFWTVDLPEKNDTEVAYVLTATIADADGNTVNVSFNKTLPVIDSTGITSAPVEGVAYKLYMSQVNLSQKLYALNTDEQSHKYIQTTNDATKAADFFVEKEGDGYKWYTLIDGVKNYVYAQGVKNNSGNISKYIGFSTENATVFNYVSETNSWQTTIDGIKYVVGTYNTYNTICISEATYINAENTGVSQFVVEFMDAKYASTLTPDKEPETITDSKVVIEKLYALADGEVLGGTFVVTGVITELDSYGNPTIVVEGMENYPALCYKLTDDQFVVGATITVTSKMLKNYKETYELMECTLKNIVLPGEESTEPVIAVVDVPVADVAYKFGLFHGNEASDVFFNGQNYSNYAWYLAYSADASNAVDVYLETVEGVEGAYRLYFMLGETKTYIRAYPREGDTTKGTLELTATVPTEYYTYDAEYKTLIYTSVTGEQFYMGSSGTYKSISLSAISYITNTTSYVAHLYTVTGVHEHAYTVTDTAEPTCDAPGYTTYTCSCGKSYTETGAAALGHNYVDGSCSVCGKAESAPAPSPSGEIVFDFGENGAEGTHVDGTDIGTSKTYTSGNYELVLVDALKAFDGGFDQKGNSILKFGTSSVAGTITFVVPDDVTSVVIYAACYKSYADNNIIVINGTSYTLTTFSDKGEYEAITVDTTTNKTVTVASSTDAAKPRCVVNTIVFVTGEGSGSDTPACQHTNTTENTTAATCTADGKTTVVCADCGATVSTTVLPAAGHNYVDGTCSVCGDVKSNFGIVDPVVGTAYKFGLINPTKDNNVYYLSGGMAATYYLATSSDLAAALDVYLETAEGGYYLYVIDNGAKLYINFTVSGTYVNSVYAETPVTVFTYDAALQTVVTDVDGVSYAIGTRNDKNYTTVGPVKVSMSPFICNFYGEASEPVCQHEYEENIFWHPELVAATCCTPGVAVFECIYCDHYYTVETEIDPEAHAFWGEEQILVEANCATQTNGKKLVACSNGCGAIEEQEIYYSELHNWDVQKEVYATCTTDGEYYAVCTLCGEVEEYSVTAEGHYNWHLTCGESGECLACGETFTVEHSWYGPSCTEAAVCFGCWATGEEALGHDFVEGVCTRCEEADPDFVPAGCEHEYTYACDTTCAKCGEITNETAAHADENGDFKCDYCSTTMLPAANEALTIEQAIALGKLFEKDTYTTNKYYITGIITEVQSTVYGNVMITDGTYSILVYGLYSFDGSTRYDALTYKPVPGDEITVWGVIGYYTASQMKNGWIDEVVAHTCEYSDATCEKLATCVHCGATTGEKADHNYVDGTCTGCGASEGVTIVEKTLDFSNKANRTSQTSSQQVWAANGVTLTNDQASSTSAVADYANPARFYKSSKITVECAGMTKIEFVCNSASYASALKSSIAASSDYTVTVSGSTVTVTFNAPVDTFVIASLSGGQVRMNSMKVYAQEA